MEYIRTLAWDEADSIVADRQIPTILSYVDGEEYYGGQAKAFLVRNPNNTIAYFKEFLGKEWVCTFDRKKRSPNQWY